MILTYNIGTKKAFWAIPRYFSFAIWKARSSKGSNVFLRYSQIVEFQTNSTVINSTQRVFQGTEMDGYTKNDMIDEDKILKQKEMDKGLSSKNYNGK